MTASRQMGIFKDYDSYDAIPPAKKAWITINAKKQGKNPKWVHAGIKAAFTKRLIKATA